MPALITEMHACVSIYIYIYIYIMKGIRSQKRLCKIRNYAHIQNNVAQEEHDFFKQIKGGPRSN